VKIKNRYGIIEPIGYSVRDNKLIGHTEKSLRLDGEFIIEEYSKRKHAIAVCNWLTMRDFENSIHGTNEPIIIPTSEEMIILCP
jgi:hypothetical protein